MGSDFFQEDPEVVRATLIEKASKRVVLRDRIELGQEISFKDLLTEHQRLQLGMGKDVFEARNDKRKSKGKTAWKEYTMDAEQNVGPRTRVMGDVMMTIITHGVYWNSRADRMLLKNELMSCNGIQTVMGAHSDEDTYMNKIDTSQLSLPQVTHLVGNAMHFQILFLIRCYIAACIQRINNADNNVPASAIGEVVIDSQSDCDTSYLTDRA